MPQVHPDGKFPNYLIRLLPLSLSLSYHTNLLNGGNLNMGVNGGKVEGKGKKENLENPYFKEENLSLLFFLLFKSDCPTQTCHQQVEKNG